MHDGRRRETDGLNQTPRSAASPSKAEEAAGAPATGREVERLEETAGGLKKSALVA